MKPILINDIVGFQVFSSVCYSKLSGCIVGTVTYVGCTSPCIILSWSFMVWYCCSSYLHSLEAGIDLILAFTCTHFEKIGCIKSLMVFKFLQPSKFSGELAFDVFFFCSITLCVMFYIWQWQSLERYFFFFWQCAYGVLIWTQIMPSILVISSLQSQTGSSWEKTRASLRFYLALMIIGVRCNSLKRLVDFLFLFSETWRKRVSRWISIVQISKHAPGTCLSIEREGHTHGFCCTVAGSVWVAQHVATRIKTRLHQKCL